MESTRVPRLRGVFHQYGFFAALCAGVVLVALADGYLERFAVSVYVTALAAMLGASALYHRFPWRSAEARLRARRLDHAMIFVFIAGAYTPFALLEFGDPARVVVLTTVWVGAALGLAGLAALVSVDAVEPSDGDVVLVVGATGGVGALRHARRTGGRERASRSAGRVSPGRQSTAASASQAP